MVPAFRDVEHTLRELAGDGAVFGTAVVRFEWLFETIAERCGAAPARAASKVQLELLMEEAVRGLDLRELRDSAAQPGFARAAARLGVRARARDGRAGRVRACARAVGRARAAASLRPRGCLDLPRVPRPPRRRRPRRRRPVRLARGRRAARAPARLRPHARARVRVRRLHPDRARRARDARRAGGRGRDGVAPLRGGSPRVPRGRAAVRAAARAGDAARRAAGDLGLVRARLARAAASPGAASVRGGGRAGRRRRRRPPVHLRR